MRFCQIIGVFFIRKSKKGQKNYRHDKSSAGNSRIIVADYYFSAGSCGAAFSPSSLLVTMLILRNSGLA